MAKANRNNIKGKQPVVRTVLIPANDEDASRYDTARAAVTRAKVLGNTEDQARAESELAEVTAQVRESGLEFVFRGIGRKHYEEVLREHPPTDAQKAEAEERKAVAPQWNVETFPAALCHASTVDGELSAEEWQADIFDSPDWGPGELNALFNAALEANSDRRVVQLGN